MTLQIPSFLLEQLWGNTFWQYLTSGWSFLIAFITLKILRYLLVTRLSFLAKRTINDVDDFVVELISAISWPFYIMIPFYIAVQPLSMPDYFFIPLKGFTILVIIIALVKGILRLVDFVALKMATSDKETDVDHSLVQLFRKILKLIVWILALIFILSNFGLDVSALLTGIGISGIAVAFALQNILSDIFASFSIFFDKPFQVGDFVTIDKNTAGLVKQIGIKSTRFQTFEGYELIISNKTLAETNIINRRSIKRRQVRFKIGVTYETDTNKLKKIPNWIQKIILKEINTRVERIHLVEMGDFSLIFEIVYGVKTSNFEDFLDIQQAILLAILEKLAKEKVEIAYPTQMVQVSQKEAKH